MIVQCDKCLTKFKISDEKIKGKVVRIRCARCHQPFTVRGEELGEKKESNNEGHEAVTAALNAVAQNIKVSHKGGAPKNNPDLPSAEAQPDHKDLSLGDETNELDKNIETNKPFEDFSTAGTLDLSIGAPLGEDPSGENPAADAQPSADKGVASGKGVALGLNSDAVSVDGEEQEQPETDAEPSDELDLDFSLDDDKEDEFIPDNAPPEEIIENGEDEGELDLGVSTGVTIDPVPEQPELKQAELNQAEPNQDNEDDSSIEETLEESGFGFSLDEPQDDTETDFTKDIAEFPEIEESKKTEFPDFSSEFDSELGSALKKELADQVPSKKDSAEDLGIEDLTEEPSTEDAPAQEIQKDADSEQDSTPEAPETDTPETNTSDDNKDEFGLTNENETTDSTDDEFAVLAEPTPDEDDNEDDCDDKDEVFKGFAGDLEEDEANLASETYEADHANESQDKTPDQFATPEDTAPYAGETKDSDPAPESYDKPYEEPAQANYNHEPPLPFDTPSSPKPDMTFTPQPAIESSDNYSVPATNHAKKKSANSKWLPIIILAIIVYGGIAALYSTGMIGPPQISQSELAPIQVERIRGVFIKNKEMGRIFAIEGRIRNFSEEPQGIRMIRGVLKDGQGRIIAAKKVTPGKIISKEALKTISKNNLRKQLNGVPGGSIPPKGSIPVMIVFTKLPKGFAGAGVEVYRR